MQSICGTLELIDVLLQSYLVYVLCMIFPQILEGHTDFINSLTFDPDTGDQLASVGDDKWCKIWDRDGNQQLSFSLSAPGMSVCWHRDEPLKVRCIVISKSFVRVLFLRNFAYAKFRENKTLTIWPDHSVVH